MICLFQTLKSTTENRIIVLTLKLKEVLKKNSFDWIQGSTYLTQSEDLGNLFRAIEALKKIEWFRKSVRDIRGYKVENWSNFTDFVKDI